MVVTETVVPFTESHKDLLSKAREDMVGGRPSIVFKPEAVAVEIHIRKSTNVCKAIVRIVASKFNPF